MAVVTTHPRAMHGNLATMEPDLSLGPAPAVADAASATIMRRAGELLRVIAKYLLDGSDSGRQTETLKGAVHILPSRLKAGHERERRRRGNSRHGVALLCGFDTPSLTAQRRATPPSLIQQRPGQSPSPGRPGH